MRQRYEKRICNFRRLVGNISEDDLRDVDLSSAILVTETDRIDACNFYQSVGYKPEIHKGFKKKLK